jgi:hypothetical protein
VAVPSTTGVGVGTRFTFARHGEVCLREGAVVEIDTNCSTPAGLVNPS